MRLLAEDAGSNTSAAYFPPQEDDTLFQKVTQRNIASMPFPAQPLGTPGNFLGPSETVKLHHHPTEEEGKPHPSMITNRSAFVSKEDHGQSRNQKTRFPCPDHSCSKEFLSTTELKKHLAGDHDKDSTFICGHSGCFMETNRSEMWKRHHTAHHHGCRGSQKCVNEKRSRERKNWGCGICVKLFTDARSYAEHYKDHFEDGETRKSDLNFSTLIQSLLMQDATKDQWQMHCNGVRDKEGKCYLAWEPEDADDIRQALEYGTFNGSSIADSDVAEELLNEVVARAKPHPKRHASTSPDHRAAQAAGMRKSSGNQTFE